MRLTEVYFECRTSILDATNSAVGVSSGTVLSIKVAIVVLLALILTRRRNQKADKFQTFGFEEREEVCSFSPT